MRPSLVLAGAVARRRAGGGGGGAPQHIQTSNFFEGWLGSGGATLTFGAGVGSGRSILVAVRCDTSASFTVTDNQAGTYTLDYTGAVQGSQHTRFYSRHGVGNAPTQVVIGNTSTGGSAFAVEVSGVSSFEVGAGGSQLANQQSHSLGFTSTVNNVFVIAHYGADLESTLTATAPAVRVRSGAVYNDGFYGVYPTAGANALQFSTPSNVPPFPTLAAYRPAS